MRRTLAAVTSAGVLALPVAGGLAATRADAAAAARRIVAVRKVSTRKVTGVVAQADRWGTVQVVVTVRTTTVITGSKQKVTRRYTDLGGQYSYHTPRSQYIMSQALPYLRQEFLTEQSANVQAISGATYTSEAFVQSLQSALLKVRS
jgi:uncharacterized protein with FMN-binding domain